MQFLSSNVFQRILTLNHHHSLRKKKPFRSSIISLQWIKARHRHRHRHRQRLPCPSARCFPACSTTLHRLRPPSRRAYFLACSTIFHHLRSPGRSACSRIGKSLRRPSTLLKLCSTSSQSDQLLAATESSFKRPLPD